MPDRVVVFLSLTVLMTMVAADGWCELTIEPGRQTAASVTLEFQEDGVEQESTVYFLLFVPAEYKSTGSRWPLLLSLHGLGESGENELDRVKIHGPAGQVDDDPDFPFVLVSPQCPPPGDSREAIFAAWRAPLLLALLDHIAEHVRVDEDRFYVTGLSMGGYGTWRLAATAPERFAAVAPVCGGGDVSWAESLRSVPIWCFHGAKDQIVPIAESQKIVDAVRQHGGNVRFTVYPDVGHDAWVHAYGDGQLFDWFLSQRREGN
jgi:predicted peptidase